MERGKANYPSEMYIASVLNPFATESVRAPSQFYTPTSILDYRFELDYTFGTTYGVALILP
jgi:hypothetical protein